MYLEITAKDLEVLVHEGKDIELIDVREKNEWDMVRIRGTKLIPLSSLPFRLSEIDFSKPVYLFCRTWARSGQACAWLQGQWKTATNIAGSVKALYEGKSDILEITEKFQEKYLS